MKDRRIWTVGFVLLAIVCTAFTSPDKGQTKQKKLEVSFNYERQNGPGSNQYAVWIENANGEVVRTLFVTSFTTKGRARGNEPLVRGYIKRPACVPAWVKAVKADNLTDAELDGFSGATPQSNGRQSFTWDFTDQKGQAVPEGKYTVRVEATLFNASTITYSGTFSTSDKTGNVALTSSITEENESHKTMVTNVTAILTAK